MNAASEAAAVEKAKDADLRQAWERALSTEYLKGLVAQGLVEARVVLPYGLLHRANANLAEELVTNPTRVLNAGRGALESLVGPVPLRISGHAPATSIGKLRSVDANHLVTIEGLVKRASEVHSQVEDALFQCKRCDALLCEPQDEHLVLKEPMQCYDDQGGCGHSSGFKLMTAKSNFVDVQVLDVQEAPEELRVGDVPQRLRLMAEREMAGLVRPGDRVVVTGILRLHPKKRGSVKSTLFDRHLQVVYVESRQQSYEDLNISTEDEARIKALAAQPNILTQLTQSIAPSLSGLEAEKRGIVLHLFGGVRKQNPDGTSVRGDIHIGLVGDPGIAKSQLLRYAAKISPRGYYADGPSASGAGLTAAAVQDKEDKSWTYEAGAMPLAHGGLCAVDEADKMDEDDRNRILTAMEQGVVKITKAGIDAELPSQCSLLVAANPKEGRFDLKYASISEQIDLPAPFLSRLDVIFVMLDTVDETRDRATMEHIVFQGAKDPPVPTDLLRKYVAYARRTHNPVLSRRAGERIVDYYVSLRKKKADPEKVVVTSTPREGEALRRLAQAAARVRLSDEVQPEDVEVAAKLMDEALERMDWDTDKAISGTGATKRDAIHKILTIIASLEAENPDGAPLAEVVKRAWDEEQIPERRVVEIVERLREDARLYQPVGKPTHYRRA